MTPTVQIYDRHAFEEALGEDDGFRGPLDEYPPPVNIERTTEGEIWARTMRKILASPYGNTRPVLVGTPEMAAQLLAETAVMPHFGVITGILERAIRLSATTGRPLHIPKILALGPPGVGKTFYTKTVARVLDTACVPIAMNGTSDRGQLGGLSTAWRGAKIGKLAKGLLLGCPTASPLYLLDELDKATSLAGENVIDVLLSVLEPENARAFVDEYIDLPIDLSHAIFLATANGTDTIPGPVLSRVMVVEIPELTAAQSRGITRAIAGTVIEAIAGTALAGISDRAVEDLIGMNARELRKIFELAIPFAVVARRPEIGAADVAKALVLLESGKKTPMGFVA